MKKMARTLGFRLIGVTFTVLVAVGGTYAYKHNHAHIVLAETAKTSSSMNTPATSIPSTASEETAPSTDNTLKTPQKSVPPPASRTTQTSVVPSSDCASIESGARMIYESGIQSALSIYRKDLAADPRIKSDLVASYNESLREDFNDYAYGVIASGCQPTVLAPIYNPNP